MSGLYKIEVFSANSGTIHAFFTHMEAFTFKKKVLHSVPFPPSTFHFAILIEVSEATQLLTGGASLN